MKCSKSPHNSGESEVDLGSEPVRLLYSVEHVVQADFDGERHAVRSILLFLCSAGPLIPSCATFTLRP